MPRFLGAQERPSSVDFEDTSAEARQALWRRAAEEPLNSPTQPEEPWSEHYFFKALALDHLGRNAEARALYERLAALADDARMLETEPTPPPGALRFVLAGLGLRALGHDGEARSAFQRALEIEPGNERAREELERR